MTTKTHKLAVLSVSLAAMAAIATPAFATDGMFSYGFGARQKGLGGAGVADGRDATTVSLNPAGLTHVGTEVSASMTMFSPNREFTGDANPGFTPNGTVESGNSYFYIPNMAASIRLAPAPISSAGCPMKTSVPLQRSLCFASMRAVPSSPGRKRWTHGSRSRPCRTRRSTFR